MSVSGLIVLGLPSADDTLTLGVYMEKHRLMQSSRSQIIKNISDIFQDLEKLPSLTLLEQVIIIFNLIQVTFQT